MAPFRSKGPSPADKRADEAEADARELRATIAEGRKENARLQTALREARAPEGQTLDLIGSLLALETPAREAALNYPSGPNSDAVKSALTSAAHGIAHVRKALDQVRRLA